MVTVKEEEINEVDWGGKVNRTFWRIVYNPQVKVDWVQHKPTGRWRYRKIEFVDDEVQVRIYPDTWKKAYKY